MVDRPVARVVVDSPLAHLDRPFDYAVPASMADAAAPGTRVKVRFAGQDVDAYVLERRVDSDHDGPLTPLRRVVSAEPVLTPDVVRLARAVADRYAGTLSDVLRLAVPPRHATTEGETSSPTCADGPPGSSSAHLDGDHEAWQPYRAGAALLSRLGDGRSPRAVWAALPGATHWAEAILEAAAVVLDAGRGVVVVLPDRRDVDVLDRVVLDRLGPGRHVRLEADLGPAARYRSFLACRRGEVSLAIGTRSAAFAPVADLGLAVIWDDGDDSHAEPRSPYPHSREVLRLRVEQAGAALLVGGWTVSAEASAWVRSDWARLVEADRTTRRRSWPRVVTAMDAAGPEPAPGGLGLPTGAWRAVRRGLDTGPVLVQVPLAGYLPAVACARCRRAARCPHCAGPVRLGEDGVLGCGWCGRQLVPWACSECGAAEVRARQIGVHRSAEELGRAFPGTAVVLSRPDRRLPEVGQRPAIVVATSGVEPPAAAGYAAAVLLDGDLVLARPDLRAGEEALRRWSAAAALVRPAGAGGEVVICADPAAPAVQALVRLDPAGFADRELDQRAELALPPASCTVSLDGDPSAVIALLDGAGLGLSGTGISGTGLPGARTAGAARPAEPAPPVEVLGPIPLPGRRPSATDEAVVETGFPLDPDPVRVLVRTPAERGPQLTAALRAAARVRSARKEHGAVRIQVDPRHIG